MAKKLYFQYELVGKNNRKLKDADNFEKASKFNLYYGDELALKNEPFPKRLKSSKAKLNHIYKIKEKVKAYIKELEKEFRRQIIEETKALKLEKVKLEKEVPEEKEFIQLAHEEIELPIRPERTIEIDNEFEKELEKLTTEIELEESFMWVQKDGQLGFAWDTITEDQFIYVLSDDHKVNDDHLSNYYLRTLKDIDFRVDVRQFHEDYKTVKTDGKSYSNFTFLNNLFIPLNKRYFIKNLYPKTSKLLSDYIKEYSKTAFTYLMQNEEVSNKDEINMSSYFPFFSVTDNKVVNFSEKTKGYEDLFQNAMSLSYMENIKSFIYSLDFSIESHVKSIPDVILRENYQDLVHFDVKGYYFTGINFHIKHR